MTVSVDIVRGYGVGDYNPLFRDVPRCEVEIYNSYGATEDIAIQQLRSQLRELKRCGVSYHVVRRGNKLYIYVHGDLEYYGEKYNRLTLVYEIVRIPPIVGIEFRDVVKP